MFLRLRHGTDETVRIEFDGEVIAARTGETVAAALLASGHPVSRRTGVKGVARGPFCMMGVCYDCLMVIDDEANRRACQTIVRDGMRVAPQRGGRRLAIEVARSNA